MPNRPLPEAFSEAPIARRTGANKAMMSSVATDRNNQYSTGESGGGRSMLPRRSCVLRLERSTSFRRLGRKSITMQPFLQTDQRASATACSPLRPEQRSASEVYPVGNIKEVMMRRLTTTLAALVMLAGTSVATFAAEGSSTPGGAAAKGGTNTTSGAAGTASHSNTGIPNAATNPPPSTGCRTTANAMKQGNPGC